jgi:hypothetical protein
MGLKLISFGKIIFLKIQNGGKINMIDVKKNSRFNYNITTEWIVLIF